MSELLRPGISRAFSAQISSAPRSEKSRLATTVVFSVSTTACQENPASIFSFLRNQQEYIELEEEAEFQRDASIEI